KGKPVAASTSDPLHHVRWNAGERYSAVDISANGSHFLAARLGAGDKSVRVWETVTGKLVKELPGFVARFSPDGQFVVACGGGGDFHVFALNLAKKGKVKDKESFTTRAAIWNFDMARAGQRLFAVWENGGEVWDWAKRQKLCDFPWRAGDLVVFT